MQSSSSLNSAPIIELQEAISEIKKASKLPPRQRKSKITLHVKAICKFSYDQGLEGDSVDVLADILTQPNQLDQASTNEIIRNLFPNTKVSDTTILNVIGCLGQGMSKPALSVQAALLKWLVMAYNVLESPNLLSKLYPVMFNLLDMISLRSSLCHLLALVTRRKHVRPFRIQILLELARAVGNEPAIIGLIRVFKNYYPDIIVGEIITSRNSYFTHPNPEWRQRLLLIQETYAQRHKYPVATSLHTFRVARREKVRGKAGGYTTIPEVHTSRANESSVTMDEVENVQDFVQKLESIDLPNQLVSALGDSLLQHFLLLRPSAAADMRIDSWLSAYFEDELLAFQEERAGRNSLTDVLQKCLSYIKFTKFLLPAVDKFLQKYLYQWDGKSDRPVILEILAYVSISSFDDLFSTYFSPLERALLDNTTGSQVHLLEYYTGVLRQWTISSFLTYAPEASPEDPASPILQVETEAFARLADRSDALCLSILESKQSTAPPPSLLAFYEQIIFALEESPLAVLSAIRITAPSAYLIYQLAFTNCLSTISRLCMILAGYKRALEKAMQVTGTFEEGSHSAQQVHKFNGYLLDICNCLWRSRAFNIEDANATGCMVPTAILPLLKQYAEAHKLALPTMFSLSHSTTLCALAAECFRDLEDAASAKGALKTRHQGVVTQTSLLRLAQNGGLRISWADYRFEVLKWLELKGVNGVGELMYNTMKHLMVTREKWLAERNKGRG